MSFMQRCVYTAVTPQAGVALSHEGRLRVLAALILYATLFKMGQEDKARRIRTQCMDK